jgi:hypothetical protein
MSSHSLLLIHPEGKCAIPAVEAITKCRLFQKNPRLANSPYSLRSQVPLPIFRQFVSALSGHTPKITSENVADLSKLSEEFGFEILSTHISEFQTSSGFHETADVTFGMQIDVLTKQAEFHNRDISEFRSRFSRDLKMWDDLMVQISLLAEDFKQLESEATLRRSRSDISAPTIKLKSTRSSAISTLPSAPNRTFNSTIISEFPRIFAEFEGKRFSLLWRGSRDGFSASEFHRRCDGHANTLTVILDTNGNIFGGFTPVEWDSRSSSPWHKVDYSLKSFLFSLKNPQNIQAKRFALKPTERHYAILCSSGWGPHFFDIAVSNKSNLNSNSYSRNFGSSYNNDTGIHGFRFFTGSEDFKVKEIEVFKITN